MNRKFNFSDELLLQYGSTMMAYLDIDLPLFTSFDKDLHEAIAKRKHLYYMKPTPNWPTKE